MCVAANHYLITFSPHVFLVFLVSGVQHYSFPQFYNLENKGFKVGHAFKPSLFLTFFLLNLFSSLASPILCFRQAHGWAAGSAFECRDYSRRTTGHIISCSGTCSSTVKGAFTCLGSRKFFGREQYCSSNKVPLHVLELISSKDLFQYPVLDSEYFRLLSSRGRPISSTVQYTILRSVADLQSDI
jgi:hypothetical protein